MSIMAVSLCKWKIVFVLIMAQSLSSITGLLLDTREGSALPLAWVEVAAEVTKVQCKLLAEQCFGFKVAGPDLKAAHLPGWWSFTQGS
jgi:hypothetical protein